MDNATQPTERLFRLSAVETQVGLSRSEIYSRVKLGTFPRPVKLGKRTVAWTATSIDTWIKSLIKQGSK